MRQLPALFGTRLVSALGASENGLFSRVEVVAEDIVGKLALEMQIFPTEGLLKLIRVFADISQVEAVVGDVDKFGIEVDNLSKRVA
jgi:hypothetical protein